MLDSKIPPQSAPLTSRVRPRESRRKAPAGTTFCNPAVKPLAHLALKLRIALLLLVVPNRLKVMRHFRLAHHAPALVAVLLALRARASVFAPALAQSVDSRAVGLSALIVALPARRRGRPPRTFAFVHRGRSVSFDGAIFIIGTTTLLLLAFVQSDTWVICVTRVCVTRVCVTRVCVTRVCVTRVSVTRVCACECAVSVCRPRESRVPSRCERSWCISTAPVAQGPDRMTEFMGLYSFFVLQHTRVCCTCLVQRWT